MSWNGPETAAGSATLRSLRTPMQTKYMKISYLTDLQADRFRLTAAGAILYHA
jgi:hypothetical protein